MASIKHINTIACALLCAALASATTAVAANIVVQRDTIDHTGEDYLSCNVELTGPIEKGDATKLAAAMKTVKQDSGPESATLCLNSPGGSVPEALEMIDSVFGNSYRTVIGPGSRCTSACAFLFLAGAECAKYTCMPGRYLHVAGRLGFHAPYMNVARGNYTENLVKMAYHEATAQIGKLIDIFSASAGMGNQKGRPWVSIRLFSETLKKGPDTLYHIDTVGKAGAYNIELFGVAKVNNPTRRMLYNACINTHHWQDNHIGEYDYLDSFSDDENGPRLANVKFQNNSSDYLSTTTLSQELHYVYDSWDSCEVSYRESSVSVFVDEHGARTFGDWVLFPGDTPIRRLGDPAFIQRIKAR